MSEALGRVVATERKPNTPHEFHFWTAIDSPVGIGTIVRVDGAQPIEGQIPHIYGIVVEGFSYTDLQSPMHDVLGHDGSPTTAGFASTERAEIRLYTAAVLRQIPEEPLQPVPMGQVYPRRGSRRAGRAPDGQLPSRRREHRNSDRRLPRRRHRRGDLPRRRFPARARGRSPEHHRRIGSCHQDQRGRVAARIAVQTFPGREGLDRGRLLQRQRPGPLLSRSTGENRRLRRDFVREAGRRAEAVRERRVFRAVHGERARPQHFPEQRGAAGQRHAPNLGFA